ncbi:acetyl-CoA C-acyltransferase [Arthrobacter sp. BHU FT2]|nr:acetyl-CoA C-acyltransferase [Arthrobacter sp. BHU FT2]
MLGALAPLPATELGTHAIKTAVERSGLSPDDVQAVSFGSVVQAGAGPNVARLAATAAGIPLLAPATTINKLCLSGLAAVGYADLLIGAGHIQTAVAGGTESMTNAPHLTHARQATKFGNTALADALEKDALVCGLDNEIMGSATERYQQGLAISRAEQDDFAARSHSRASAARDLLAEEIAPVTVRQGRQEAVVSHDEGVRPQTTAESLAALRPAFAADGTITAGSASQISDGAAALVIMDRAEAERRGIPWLAEIVSYASVAGPDPSLLHQPARAIERALDRARMSVEEIDLFEINEAFASVAIASMRELGTDAARVNVNGGAIALGHPVGMSGARLTLTLAYELRRRGGGIGSVALCGGGGQGDALILRVPREAS